MCVYPYTHTFTQTANTVRYSNMTTKTTNRAGMVAHRQRAFKRGAETKADMELLTLSDGTKPKTDPQGLTEEKLQHFLADARSGKPYPVEAELGEIGTEGTIRAGRVQLDLEEVNRYSPIALALANGWLDRLRDFLEGKR